VRGVEARRDIGQIEGDFVLLGLEIDSIEVTDTLGNAKAPGVTCSIRAYASPQATPNSR
jgi:hypothetical protein